jgi:hypothetical protein
MSTAAMTARAKRLRWLIAALIPAAGAALAGSYELVAPDAEAGGGALAGGTNRAFVTIAASGSAVPLSGGPYEVTSGLTRRRASAAAPDPLFSDGFE